MKRKLVFILTICLVITTAGCRNRDAEVVYTTYPFDEEMVAELASSREINEYGSLNHQYFKFNDNEFLIYTETETYVYTIDTNEKTYIYGLDDIHPSHIYHVDIEKEQYIYFGGLEMILYGFDGEEIRRIDNGDSNYVEMYYLDETIFLRPSGGSITSVSSVYDLDLNEKATYTDSRLMPGRENGVITSVFLLTGTENQVLYEYKFDQDTFVKIGNSFNGLGLGQQTEGYYNFIEMGDVRKAYSYDKTTISEFDFHVESTEELVGFFFDEYVHATLFDGTTYTYSIYNFENELLGEFTSLEELLMVRGGKWCIYDTVDRIYTEYDMDGNEIFTYAFAAEDHLQLRTYMYGDLRYLILNDGSTYINGETEPVDFYTAGTRLYGYYTQNDEVTIYDINGELTEVEDENLENLLANGNAYVIDLNTIIHIPQNDTFDITIYNHLGDEQISGSFFAYQLYLKNDVEKSYGALILTNEGEIVEITLQ